MLTIPGRAIHRSRACMDLNDAFCANWTCAHMQVAQKLAARARIARVRSRGGFQARQLLAANHAGRRHEEHRPLQALDHRAAGPVLPLMLHLDAAVKQFVTDYVLEHRLPQLLNM